MSFIPADPGLAQLSARVTRGDAWLKDGLHLRFDTHPALGFPQTPWIVTWNTATPSVAALGSFDTTLASDTDWRMVHRQPVGMIDAARPNGTWTLRPDRPLEFFLKSEDMLVVEVEASGQITAQGLVFGRNGYEVALEVTGDTPALSGERLRAVRLTSRRAVTIRALRGVPASAPWKGKVFFPLDQNRHAVSFDALIRSAWFEGADRTRLTALLADSAQGATEPGAPRGAMPDLNGRVPPEDVQRAQIMAQFQHLERLSASLRGLVEAGADQQDRTAQFDATDSATGGTRNAALSEYAEVALASETAGLAAFLGRRMTLKLDGLGARVPISARAIFAVGSDALNRLGVPRSAHISDLANLRDSLGAPFAGQIAQFMPTQTNGPYVGLEVRSVVDTRVLAPLVRSPTLGEHPTPDPFVPERDARRVVLNADVLARAQLTFDRRHGFATTRLNPAHAQGHHIPIYAARVETEGSSPGDPVRTRLRDDDAPTDSLVYRVAQSDGFGRWSAMSARRVPVPPRPLPPAPTVVARWRPDKDGAGKIALRIAAPHRGMMPPGAQPITGLTLSLSLAGTRDARHDMPITGPLSDAPSDTPLIHEFDIAAPRHPGLPPREATISAHWTIQPLPAQVKTTVTLDLPDPSPPPAPTLTQPTLTPLGQPDMSGICRAELVVNGIVPGTSHLIVEAAQEMGIRAALEQEAGLADQLAQIAALSDLAERAEAFKALEAAIPDSAWSLSGEVPVTNATALVSHAVNGLPPHLVALRIRARTSAGASSTSGPVAWFGLPSAPTLAAPLLRVTALTDKGTPRFRIEIARPPGPRPSQIRLRRSSVSDLPVQMLQLPLVTVPQGEDVRWPLVVIDEGQTDFGAHVQLPPYRTVYWRAEARGAARFAGAPEGPWTKPGPVAHAMWVPETPPGTPKVAVDVLREGRLELVIENLQPGSALEITADPPEAMTGAAEIETDGDQGRATVPVDVETLRAVHLQQVDPLGRRSGLATLSITEIEGA